MEQQPEQDSAITHLERMRQRLDSNGADGMTPTQVMTLLLSYSIPAEQAGQVAQALLKRFGSFSRVLHTATKELVKVKGMQANAAALLHQMPQFARYYMEDVAASPRRIFNVESACAQMRSRFIGRTYECVSVLILNARGQVVFHDIITQGSVAQVPVYVRELVALCIQYQGDAVFMAHNHPSGNLAPSKGDLTATKELQIALGGIYVNLEDHIIFTDSGHTSLRKSGWLTNMNATVEQLRQSMLAEAVAAEETLTP